VAGIVLAVEVPARKLVAVVVGVLERRLVADVVELVVLGTIGRLQN
jgi:hypothetical protein